MKFVIIYGHVFDLLDHVFLIGKFKSLSVRLASAAGPHVPNVFSLCKRRAREARGLFVVNWRRATRDYQT